MVTVDRKIWLNGEIVNVSDAKVNVLAPTSQFGANVFEGIRCYWNTQEEQLYGFRLEEHFERLKKSIRLFQINSTYTKENFYDSFISTVRANGYKEDIAVRQTVFVDGFGSWFSKEPVGMFVSPIPKKRKEIPLENGEKICVSSWERISDKNFPPRIKVGANYINSRLAKIEAENNGYDGAVFLNYLGYVAEGMGSSFFMVKDRKLITPLLTDSVLESITRDTIIQIAQDKLGIEVEERSINRTELYICDEAFFCGSAVEVTPIVQIDSYTIGKGIPGSITRRVHEKYIDIVSGNDKMYKKWLTPIYKGIE